MQEIKKYLLAVSLVFLGCMVYGQDARTASLRWNSSQSVELKSDSAFQADFQIETSAGEIKITTGEQTRLFTITSATGEWPDVNVNGTVTYDLLFGQKAGSAVLKREHGSWEFVLDFSNHPNGIRQKFVLSGFQLIP